MGVPEKYMGITWVSLRRRGRGGGAGEVSGYPYEGAGGGDAGRSAWASSYRGAGGVGEAEGVCGYLLPEKCTGIPLPKARVGDAGEERIGFPPSEMPAENVAPGGNVSAFRASLCPRHLFLPVSRHNLPGIEDRSV